MRSEIKPEKVYKESKKFKLVKSAGVLVLGLGFAFMLLSLTGMAESVDINWFLISIVMVSVGTLVYFIPQFFEGPPGIKHNNILQSSFMNRGVPAWIIGVMMIVFYCVLYWYPEYMEKWIRFTDPVSEWLRGKPADKWFLYGIFYTLSVLVMSVRMFAKYRHNRYHLIRTISVSFFQLGFAFIIPIILANLSQPGFYFHYFWPLKYEYLFPGYLDYLTGFGAFGYFITFWAVAMIVIATPFLTFFFGKRWYCSWVCGCGALAETLGDPYRHLSDKSLTAWRIERVLIHSVLIFIVITTGLLWLNAWTEGSLLGGFSSDLAGIYGFAIAAVFAGVIGVGFYPLMGNRVWCRFGCPMAAILGIQQRYFSRFRITTNGSQCISCGNCSAYCEMGIDVKWYAQREQNTIRASCVGCGVCAAVCPRGVLRLENGPRKGRFNNDR